VKRTWWGVECGAGSCGRPPSGSRMFPVVSVAVRPPDRLRNGAVLVM
jgi:hypothetical protein